MRRALAGSLLVCTAILPPAQTAEDPAGEAHEFKYSLTPPREDARKIMLEMRRNPRAPRPGSLVDAQGKFTEMGQWYYDLTSDPKAFEKWWQGYFTDAQNWKAEKTPVNDGTIAEDEGQRTLAWINSFQQRVRMTPGIPPLVQGKICSAAWSQEVERILGTTISDRGLFEFGGNTADLAFHFHMLRLQLGLMGCRVQNVYTLERAQKLVCSLLTEPSMICEQDRELEPSSAEFYDRVGKPAGRTDYDARIVRHGQIVYTGGMFIGRKALPSLHGTYQGLALINTLYKYYPDPDPASPKSIFYLWKKLPAEKKDVGRKTLVLCANRLWRDWKDRHEPTWCWVVDGVPTDDGSKPSEAKFLPAYDGSGDNQFAWAKAAWDEMFGNPLRNTNDGVQALLAAVEGKAYKNSKTPLGQQVPGRFDMDAATQARALSEDEAKLNQKAPAFAKDVPLLDPARNATLSE